MLLSQYYYLLVLFEWAHSKGRDGSRRGFRILNAEGEKRRKPTMWFAMVATAISKLSSAPSESGGGSVQE
jgi:hypothetical protein